MNLSLQNISFKILSAVVFSIFFFGCQGLQPKTHGELALEDQDFLGIWDAYNHCMVGSDVREISDNLQILESAPTPISLDDSPIPVPSFLKRLSSARSSRLAVDPRAMSASCSIRLAEVAQQSADWYTAFHILESIITKYPEPRYAFYVTKASEAIKQFSSVRPVSLSLQDSLVR